MRITNLIAVASILTILFFQSTSFAQQQAAPPELKITITIESEKLSRRNPAPVTITIENLSSQILDIKSIGSFRLLSTRKEAIARKHFVFGDSFWSPVNIVAGTPKKLEVVDPELEKKGVIVGRVTDETLHFESKEVKTFLIDPTKTLWNAENGNDWPRSNLFDVVKKGVYSLEFSIDSSARVKSNAVTVTIE